MNAREQADYDAYMASRRARAAREQELDAQDDASDEDELTERRREYHDDIRADFRRLGVVGR